MSVKLLWMQLLIFIFACSFTDMGNKTAPDDNKIIRYVALGDSYTICEGATWDESWPVIMTERLSDAGIPVQHHNLVRCRMYLPTYQAQSLGCHAALVPGQGQFLRP